MKPRIADYRWRAQDCQCGRQHLALGNWRLAEPAAGVLFASRQSPVASCRYLRRYPGNFCRCAGFFPVLQSPQMAGSSSTLHVGDAAPDFTLGAANRKNAISLSQLLAKGTLILEFLRGTW